MEQGVRYTINVMYTKERTSFGNISGSITLYDEKGLNVADKKLEMQEKNVTLTYTAVKNGLYYIKFFGSDNKHGTYIISVSKN